MNFFFLPVTVFFSVSNESTTYGFRLFIFSVVFLDPFFMNGFHFYLAPSLRLTPSQIFSLFYPKKIMICDPFSLFLSLKIHFRRKQVEVETLEQTIRQRSEQQKKAGAELDATCHICLKTRFADGIGHVCHYCSIRCCARCGGKVTLRSTKVIFH